MASRSYMFVVNNYDHIIQESDLPIWVRYMVFSEEVGEEGTPHLQGYIELTKPQRYAAVQKIVGLERCHLMKRRGTRFQAKAYCSKVDDPTFIAGPYEYGDFNAGGMGARNDIADFVVSIKSGLTEREILDQHPAEYVKFYHAYDRIKMLLADPRRETTEMHLYIGAPGTGKSHKAWTDNPTAYPKQPSQWWDGYNHQEVVIMDDFYGYLTPDEMFRLGDRYPHLVQNKGGQVNFAPKKIIITSNKSPMEWWSEKVTAKRDMEALLRRFTKILYFSSKSQPPVEYDSWESFRSRESY